MSFPSVLRGRDSTELIFNPLFLHFSYIAQQKEIKLDDPQKNMYYDKDTNSFA